MSESSPSLSVTKTSGKVCSFVFGMGESLCCGVEEAVLTGLLFLLIPTVGSQFLLPEGSDLARPCPMRIVATFCAVLLFFMSTGRGEPERESERERKEEKEGKGER